MAAKGSVQLRRPRNPFFVSIHHLFRNPEPSFVFCFRFGSVAYAELGDELFDTDMVDGDTVTLLNPTKSPEPPDRLHGNKGNECDDLESCASYQSLLVHHDRRFQNSGRRSEEDPFPYE